MADTETIRNSIKKLEKKGIVIDSNGYVIDMRTTKVRTTPLGMRKKKSTGGKRGRPRTRPERTTQPRKYKRSWEHTKEAKAKAKALREEKRAAKAAEKAAAKAARDAAIEAKTKERGFASMMQIERKRSRPKTIYMPGEYLTNGKVSKRKNKVANITPFSKKVRGAPAPTLPVVSGTFS